MEKMVQGYLTYPDKVSFITMQNVLKQLNILVFTNKEENKIIIPLAYYKDFPFDNLIKTTNDYYLTATCIDDNVFEGEIFNNGEKVVYDLSDWADNHNMKLQTFLNANDDDTTAYDWREYVQEDFHDNFAVEV